jgi:acylpyruvate hydrolase
MKNAAQSLVAEGVLLPSDQVHLMAPLPVPGKVICAAGNYPSAAADKKPDYPIIFLKPSSTVTGPGMPIYLSKLTQNVAYEVELALVISKLAWHVPPEEALHCIGGYLLANDVGDRDLEKRTSQWTSGKMFDSFTPMGPWLVTKDEIPYPGEREMLTTVNGEVVQKGSTAEMFFDPAQLVSILSDLTTLRPGDVILTGSPKMMDGQPNPVIALAPGDSVTISIDGLGQLTNPVQKEAECL